MRIGDDRELGVIGEIYSYFWGGFPGGSNGKESASNAGDLGSIPELG